jgi:hypothetical protein
MKRNVLVLLSFLCLLSFKQELKAQCNPITCFLPTPALSAPDACPMCVMAPLDGFSFATSDVPNTTTQPNSFCGTVENNHWYAFAAPQADVSINFAVSNCVTPTNGGIQAEIYCTTNCTNDWTSVSNCWSPGMQQNGTVTANGLTPGDIYYLMIDGFAGDVCDYTMTITNPPGGGGVGQLPPPMGIAGDDQVCFPSATFSTYLLPPGSSCASGLIWSIQPPSAGSIVSDPTAQSILVQWNAPGVAQVCVQASNPCSVSQPGCFPVTISSIPPSTDEADICIGGTTICAGQVFSSPGVFPVTLTASNGCDSIVNCIISPLPPIPPTNETADYCAPNVHEVCGNFYSTTGFYTTVCQAFNGCDSTVITDLAIMEAIADVADPDEIGCDPNNQQVTLDGSNSTFTIAAGSDLTFEWTGPSFCGPQDDVFACVDAPGTYCFTVTVSRNGLDCSDTFCVDVEASTDTPQTPDISGPDEVCDGAMETYNVSSVGTPLPTGYTWTTPNGEPFTGSGTSITVDWTGSMGGELCVTADNDCGPSDPPACITVNVSLGPEDPTVSGDDTVCDGDEETYTIDNPDPTATYTWTVPSGASFTNNGTSIDVDFSGAMSGDICVEGDNDCGTSEEFCIAITLTTVPDEPEFTSGANVLCDGTMETYCVNGVAGATSYTWTTPNGTFPGGDVCFQMDWTGLSSGDICVTADNDCGSSTELCLSVTVDEGPTAAISGDGDFCEGSGNTVDLTIDFTGTAPWTFTYNDGTNPNVTETTSDNPFILTVGTAGTYTLVDVDDATDCSGTVSGQSVVTENLSPTATLSGSGSICQNSTDTVDLTIDLTGANDWTVAWSINGDAQAPLTITSTPFTLPITENQAGDIELTGVTDGNGCAGTVDGMVSVIVNDAPTVSGIISPCDGTNTTFTVEFTINGGDTTSYSITPNTGTLDGNVFTSDPIPSGSGYNFVVTDANDCAPVTVSAMAVICDCDTEVGTMDQELIRECGEGPVTATYDNNGEVFDADDILIYILHEGSGISIVNPLDTNITAPTFELLPSMNYGTTYYISAVVGNDDGSGTVDLTDPCLAVAQGTPVVFREIPTGILSGSTEICEGEAAPLTIDFTGQGPWRIVYDDGTGQQVLTGITTNPFTLNVSPTATTTVTLDSISNINCVGVPSGSADITVNTPVEVSMVATTCNSTATGYVVTFQISGGDPASYVVTPAGSGTIDPSGLFTSNEITAPDGYSFTVDDANSCDPQTVMDDEVICDCSTAVGTMDATAIDECGDGPVTAPYDAMGQVLDGDDVITYILHEGSGQNIVNEIARNASEPTFSFMAPMDYGTTYYISAVVGNDDGSGSVNLSDPCVSIAVGTPVTFFEVPSATLSGDPSICAGDCVNISVAFTGDAPYSITINDGSADSTVTGINSNPFNYQVCPTVTTAYSLVGVNDENCPGDINGGANVTVNEAPQIVNSQVTINATNTGYTVSFEIQGGDPSSYNVTPNNGSLVANTFTSNELPCGSGYNFSVDDDNGCGPDVVSEAMVDCSCISQAGDMDAVPLDVCGNGPIMATYLGGEQLDGNDVLCYMLHDGDESPISTNDEPSFNFSPLTMTYGVTYYICAVAGDDNGNGCVNFNDDCLSIGACTEVVYYEIPSASMSGNSDICAGEVVSVDVTFTGVGPWEFTYTPSGGGDPVTTSNITDNPFTFTVAPTVSTTYQLTGVADINCPGNANGVVAVNVFDAPFITPPQTICNSTNTGYVVTFEINGGDPTTYSVDPLNGTIDANGVFTSNEIPNGTGYQFFIDDANGCGPVEASEGFVACPCETFAGALDQVNAIDECGEGPVQFTSSTVIPIVLDGDDVLNYMLHTGDNVPLMINDDGAFTFDDAILDYDAVYLVCAVAGNDDGTGIVDFTDPCLSISDCTELSFHEIPTATISGDQAICENVDAVMTIDFTGPGPWSVTYESTTGGQQTINGVLANPYTLTVPVNTSDVFSLVSVSNTFCPGTVAGTADIQVTNAPNFDLSTLTYDCDPVNFNYTVSVEITGGDPSSYMMSGMSGTLNGNVFTSDPISGLTPFQFFVDDAFGCGPSELADVSPIPTGTISGDNTICEGGTSTVTFNLSGEGPYDIQYLDENGATQTINTPQTTVTIDVTPSATSTITLVNVSNPGTGCGHSPNESVTITVNPPANAGTGGSDNICQGVPNVFDLNTYLTGADAGGQWQNSSGSVVSSMFNTEPQAPGVYEFTYVVAGLPPCPDDETTVTIEIFELPSVDVGVGGELTCDNVSVEIGGPSVSGYSYSWTLAGGPFPGDSTQSVVDVNLPGDYTLTVTNEQGCSNSEVITVNQNAETPSADIVTSDVRCFGEDNGVITVQNVLGGSPPYLYSFNDGPFTDQTTYTDLGPGDYTIVVQDSKGCTQMLDFQILEPDELTVDLIGEFEGDEGIVNLGDSLFLQLEVSVPFGALDAVSWFPPELLACDTCSSTWAYPTLQTTFSVTVEDGGCVAEDDLTVFVKKNRPVYVPNVFAPGGGGSPENEIFRIFAGPQVSRVKNFLVFNRWGETVFEVQNYDPKDASNLNIGWDGTFRGELMDPGVFVWFAEIEFIDGEVDIYEGDVTLLR